MKKKIERWLAKKTGARDVYLKSIKISFSYIDPDTFEIRDGVKEVNLKEI